MASHRVDSVLVIALMTVFAVACAGPPGGRPAATAASPPAVARPAPTPAADALELLRTANAFEDTRVGFGGELSRYVVAFRSVLADPGASGAFHGLVERATAAGRLYGAAGLYFVDPSAFDAALARIMADGGHVATTHGCIGMEEPVASVVRSREVDRIEVALGESLPSALSRHGGGACDLAGGCFSLSLATEGRVAPRAPASLP